MTTRRDFMAGVASTIGWGAAVTSVVSGCRQRQAELPEVWDDAPVPERSEALAKLAPPWPRPTRDELSNGLLSFWLTEPGARAAHVRLLLPTSDPGGHDAALSACCAEALHFELSRRLSRAGVAVEVVETFGRIEVALHGPESTLAGSARALSVVLGRGEPTKMLDRAQARLVAQLGVPTTSELATAGLAATLLGVPAASELVDPKRLVGLATEDLTRAWRWITSPRGAVLVVHAGVAPNAVPTALEQLGTGWLATGRDAARPLRAGVLDRLRPKIEAAAPGGHLLSETSPPLFSVAATGIGNPTLCMGRLVPLGNPRERAIARLAHRVAQEEHDMQFALLGAYGLVTTRDTLPPSAVDRRVEQTLDELSSHAKTRQPQRRLFSAAQLWLGARVVQASIDGEDWTSLFSESIELADQDDEIPRALARDATLMLSIEPDELVAWTSQWLDPRGGAPGWGWAVAGAGEQMLAALRRATKADTRPL